VGDEDTIIKLSIDVSAMNLNQTVKMKLAAKTALPDYYKVYTLDLVEVGDAVSLVNDALYHFRGPTVLAAEAGSRWSVQQLNELKVVFTPICESDLPLTCSMSEKATQLIVNLKDLNANTFGEYNQATIRDTPFLQDSIVKAVYMVQKYKTLESGVDCFVQLLLDRLGFYDEWLYVFPQLRLKLLYGRVTEKDAIPDFTVMDVVSFLRMTVVEDKNYDSNNVNGEPQLIAELIAMLQTNAIEGIEESEAVKQQPKLIFGVRVNRLRFWFYFIDNPNHLLTAMANNSIASEVTRVSKLGGDNGLDFINKKHRDIIIRTLNAICCHFREKGAN
jgi:hypothetical protein